MKHTYIHIILLTVMSFFVSSCDDYEAIDMDIHPGFILCADGSIVSDTSFNPDINTPVAVIFCEKTDDHEMLAVLLDEIGPIQFADTLSFDQKTSCSITAYDGYTNTVSLQTTYIERDSLVVPEFLSDSRNYYCSPLGLSAFRHHYFYQSDYVPSVAELGLLYLAKDRVNPIISKCGGDPLEFTGDSCWYWSSTEVEQNKNNQAWLFSMSDGSRMKAAKINYYKARLIVEYNPFSNNK